MGEKRVRPPQNYAGFEFAGWNERDEPVYWSCDRTGRKELFTRVQIEYGLKANERALAEQQKAEAEKQHREAQKNAPRHIGQGVPAQSGQYQSDTSRPMANLQYRSARQMTQEEYEADAAGNRKSRAVAHNLSPAGNVRQDRQDQTPTQAQYRELSAREVEWYRVRDAAVKAQADGVVTRVNGHVLSPEEIADRAIPVTKDSVFSRR